MTGTDDGDSSVSPRDTYRDEDWIREQYFEKGRTTEEIGEIAGVSGSTIHRWAGKHDIDLSKSQVESDSKLSGWRRIEVDDGLEPAERANLRERQSILLEKLQEIKDKESKALAQYAAQHGYDIEDVSERIDARNELQDTEAGANFEAQRQNVVEELAQEYSNFLDSKYSEPAEITKKNRICVVKRGFGMETHGKALAEATNSSSSYISEFCTYPEITVSSSGAVTRRYRHEDYDLGDPPVVLQREPRSGRSISATLRNSVLSRDDHECQKCASPENLEVHHIVPVSQGGEDREENSATLCHDCHTDATLSRGMSGEIPAYPEGEFEAWLNDDLDVCGTKTNDVSLCRNPKGSCPHHE